MKHYLIAWATALLITAWIAHGQTKRFDRLQQWDKLDNWLGIMSLCGLLGVACLLASLTH